MSYISKSIDCIELFEWDLTDNGTQKLIYENSYSWINSEIVMKICWNKWSVAME